MTNLELKPITCIEGTIIYGYTTDTDTHRGVYYITRCNHNVNKVERHKTNFFLAPRCTVHVLLNFSEHSPQFIVCTVLYKI